MYYPEEYCLVIISNVLERKYIPYCDKIKFTISTTFKCMAQWLKYIHFFVQENHVFNNGQCSS